MPVTTVRPMEGETSKPEGLPPVRVSKFRYFVGLPSMALATASEPGLLAEEATIGSPGWVTSFT